MNRDGKFSLASGHLPTGDDRPAPAPTTLTARRIREAIASRCLSESFMALWTPPEIRNVTPMLSSVGNWSCKCCLRRPRPASKSRGPAARKTRKAVVTAFELASTAVDEHPNAWVRFIQSTGEMLVLDVNRNGSALGATPSRGRAKRSAPGIAHEARVGPMFPPQRLASRAPRADRRVTSMQHRHQKVVTCDVHLHGDGHRTIRAQAPSCQGRAHPLHWY